MQARFINVYKDAGRNMYGDTYQHTFLNATLSKSLLNMGCLLFPAYILGKNCFNNISCIDAVYNSLRLLSFLAIL